MTGARSYFALGGLLLIIGIGVPLSWLFNHLGGPSVPLGDASAQPRLAWFYKPPADGDLTTLARAFDFYVLTKNDEWAREALRTAGEGGPFLQYLLFTEVVEPEGCWAQPWRNQVADRVGDFCMLLEEHPDWFLRDVNGALISNVTDEGQRYVMMDPGHPGWRAFWLERAAAMQAELGYDGVFLDNVEASLSKIRNAGHTVAAYPDDASYQDAVAGFLEYLYTGYFAPEGRLLYANIIAHRGFDAVWERYLQYLHGAMDETWAVDWNDGYLQPHEWLGHLERAERIQGLGKDVILVAQGVQGDEARQTFAYASYLLVNTGRALFRYADARGAYDQMWLYPNYELDLGEPLGERRCTEEWLCERAYANGWVWVRGDARSADIAPY